MCGISGIVSLDESPVDAGVGAMMISQLAHRGPDEQSVLAARQAVLGHTRLSILDAEGGRQPMSSRDGSLSITFNGEIFNHGELRDRLRAAGHRFETRSDTEVLLHLYAQYGDACVEQLNGQWAYAIWDAGKRRLFASRDRLGVRPFFYAIDGRRLLFASEIKALWPAMERAPSIDPIALDQLFTFWTVVAPRTCFTGIRELLPGDSMVVEHGSVRTRPYWRLRYTPTEPGDDVETADRLLALLQDATALRLRADVPVAALLSGGLDSSLVTALAARVAERPVQTFSLGFDDPRFDERAFQSQTADMLGVSNDAVVCSSAEVSRVLPEVVWHAEQPLVRTAPVPMYLLASRVHRSGFRVALTGEGADEVFGGYDIFKEAKLRRFCSVAPGSRMRPRLVRRLYPYLPNVAQQSDEYLMSFFGIGTDSTDALASHRARWKMTAGLKRFFSARIRESLGSYNAVDDLCDSLPAGFGHWDVLTRAQYLESTLLLPGYILSAQGDRMAMAHAVECRHPFLDHRVVEFAASLPPRLKMRALTEKYLLRRAARTVLPKAIVARRKQPYLAPDASALFTAGAESADLEAVLSPARVRAHDVFDADAVTKLIAKARAGRVSGTRDNMALIAVLTTQLLLERFGGYAPYAATGRRNPAVRRRELLVRAG